MGRKEVETRYDQYRKKRYDGTVFFEHPYFAESYEQVKDTYRVFLAGMGQKGPLLYNKLEQVVFNYGHESCMVVPSILAQISDKKIANIEQYYAHLADHVLNEADGRHNLQLIGFSLGGHELVDLLDAIVKDPRSAGLQIDIMFVGTPGFGVKGLKGAGEVAFRLAQNIVETIIHEHEVIYPLPEECYFYKKMGQKERSGPELNFEFKENRSQRNHKKMRFTTLWAKDIMPAGAKDEQREMLLGKLDESDNLLRKLAVKLMTNPQLLDKTKYYAAMIDRCRLLYPIVRKLRKAEQERTGGSTLYDDLLEFPKVKPDAIPDDISSFSYIKVTAARIIAGIEHELLNIVETASKKDIKINMGLAAVNHDHILTTNDLAQAKKTLEQEQATNRGLSCLMLGAIRGLTHGSLDYEGNEIRWLFEHIFPLLSQTQASVVYT